MSIRALSTQSTSHSDAIWSVDWTNANTILTGGVDELLKVWSVKEESADGSIEVESKPRLIASAQTIVNTSTADAESTLPLSSSLSLLTVLSVPNTPLVLTSSMDGVIRIYDTDKLDCQRIDVGPLECWTIVLDPTSRFIACGSQRGQIHIYQLDTRQKITTLTGDKAKEGEAAQAWVMSLAWSPNGRYLAAGHFDGRITLFHMDGPQTNSAPKPLSSHNKAIRTLKFSPDSSLLFSGSDDMHIHWYEMSAGTGQLLGDLFAHQSWVTGIDLPKFSSSTSSSSSSSSAATTTPTHFASVSTDKKLKLWNLSTKECVAVMELESSAWSLAYDSTGEKVAVGTEQGKLALFRVTATQ